MSSLSKSSAPFKAHIFRPLLGALLLHPLREHNLLGEPDKLVSINMVADSYFSRDVRAGRLSLAVSMARCLRWRAMAWFLELITVRVRVWPPFFSSVEVLRRLGEFRCWKKEEAISRISWYVTVKGRWGIKEEHVESFYQNSR